MTTERSTSDKATPLRNPPVDAPYMSIPPQECDSIGLTCSVMLETGLRNYCIVSQRIGDANYFALTGDAGPAFAVKLATQGQVSGESHVWASALCFDSAGTVLWRDDFIHPTLSYKISVFPAFIDRTGRGDWGVSFLATLTGVPGHFCLKSLGGEMLWKTTIPGKRPWGNGSCIVADVDGDGRIEIVYGCCSAVVCLDAVTGRIRWTYEDRVAICHGRPAYGDVNGDGRGEICFATEYSDDAEKCLSAVCILDGQGRLLHRRGGLLGDLGSTQTVLADINHDGRPEIAVSGQNLCWYKPRHVSSIMTFDGDLNDVHSPIPTGAPRWPVADIDGDGHLEAVGVTDYRDGGPLSRFALICTDLTAGRIKWATAISRCWLTSDPVYADVDGDGRLETILTTNYGTGYSYQPEAQPWADLYIVKADGRIVFVQRFPDEIYSPIVVDIDGDGKNEIIAPCYDGKVYLLRTPGRGQTSNWPLMQQNNQRTGVSR